MKRFVPHKLCDNLFLWKEISCNFDFSFLLSHFCFCLHHRRHHLVWYRRITILCAIAYLAAAERTKTGMLLPHGTYDLSSSTNQPLSPFRLWEALTFSLRKQLCADAASLSSLASNDWQVHSIIPSSSRVSDLMPVSRVVLLQCVIEVISPRRHIQWRFSSRDCSPAKKAGTSQRKEEYRAMALLAGRRRSSNWVTTIRCCCCE